MRILIIFLLSVALISCKKDNDQQKSQTSLTSAENDLLGKWQYDSLVFTDMNPPYSETPSNSNCNQPFLEFKSDDPEQPADDVRKYLLIDNKGCMNFKHNWSAEGSTLYINAVEHTIISVTSTKLIFEHTNSNQVQYYTKL